MVVRHLEHRRQHQLARSLSLKTSLQCLQRWALLDLKTHNIDFVNELGANVCQNGLP